MKLLIPVLLFPLFTIGQLKIDLSAAPDTAAIFEAGIICTPLNERDMAISPDGKELLYTILNSPSGFHTLIYMRKDAKGQWSKPAVAPFSGQYSDLEPAFSADGNT